MLTLVTAVGEFLGHYMPFILASFGVLSFPIIKLGDTDRSAGIAAFIVISCVALFVIGIAIYGEVIDPDLRTAGNALALVIISGAVVTWAITWLPSSGDRLNPVSSGQPTSMAEKNKKLEWMAWFATAIGVIWDGILHVKGG